MKAFLSVVCILLFTGAFGAADTLYLYFDKEWQECGKDSATYVGKQWEQDGIWKRRAYLIKTNRLQMEGTFLDESCKKYQGMAVWYDEEGHMAQKGAFENGKNLYTDYFYKSGKTSGHIEYGDQGKVLKEIGWDESGNVIPGYIVEREAAFPGGMMGWMKYLEKNLNSNTPSDEGAKPGTYTVKVKFMIDKSGKVSNLRIIEAPKGCKRCGAEAVNVIAKGPDWIPAIQHNKPVKYLAVQAITYVVNEE